MRQHAVQERRFILQRQLKLLFNHQFAAQVAQRKMNITAADAHRKVVPGFGFHHQPHRRTATTPRLLDFRFLHQMGFQQLTNNFGNTGGGQLRKSGKVNTRHRAKLINETINRPCVGLLDLINMAWLTVRYHRKLPYFRASK